MPAGIQDRRHEVSVKAINAAGYGAIWHGQRAHHGVAILARGEAPSEICRGLSGDATDITFWVHREAYLRNKGFRIDFLLLNDALKPRLGETGVDAEFNARDKPSDHAPVWMTLTD